jgi:hypothetical protein
LSLKIEERDFVKSSLTDKYIYAGEKSSYHCWKIKRSGISSNLYIEKWRVPTPTPKTLDISVRFKDEYEIQTIVTRKDLRQFPEKVDEPIIEFVYRVSGHTKTIRYDSDGYDKSFNTIYLPKFMVEDHLEQNKVQVIIDWC